MKKIYLICSVAIMSSLSYGQIDITNDDDLGVSYNGETVYVNSTESNLVAHLNIVSTIGSAADYKWKRVVMDNPNSYGDQICDNETCFVCTGDVWERAAFYTLPAGESTVFQPKLSAGGVGGSAHMRYYIMDDGDVAVDSVDVIFNTTVGVEETEELEYSVYPNPVNDVLNINIESNNTSIEIFDIVGKQVASMNLVNGKNQLNIENLKAGVYFYSIKKNGDVVETRKLVVR